MLHWLERQGKVFTLFCGAGGQGLVPGQQVLLILRCVTTSMARVHDTTKTGPSAVAPRGTTGNICLAVENFGGLNSPSRLKAQGVTPKNWGTDRSLSGIPGWWVATRPRDPGESPMGSDPHGTLTEAPRGSGAENTRHWGRDRMALRLTRKSLGNRDLQRAWSLTSDKTAAVPHISHRRRAVVGALYRSAAARCLLVGGGVIGFLQAMSGEAEHWVEGGEALASPVGGVPAASACGPFFQGTDRLSFAITTALALAVYCITLAPEVTLPFSGIFSTGAYYAGVPFPPGYPL
jgi:hypothetical protein